MKKVVTTMALLASIGIPLASKTIELKSPKTPFYKNPDCSRQISELSRSEALALLKEGMTCSKVRLKNGRKGYINNTDFAYLYELDPQSVISEYTAGSPFVIEEGSMPRVDIVEISRHFNDEIFEFVDKEELEEIFDEN